MNEILMEAFEHSAWATRALVAACRELSGDQLQEPGPGFGSVLATLNHIVVCDKAYAALIRGTRPDWGSDTEEATNLDEVEARVGKCLDRWRALLAAPVDGDRLLILGDGKYECPVSVVVVQALQHANAHREQVRARLATYGLRPPDVQSWEYAGETGRARQIGEVD